MSVRAALGMGVGCIEKGKVGEREGGRERKSETESGKAGRQANYHTTLLNTSRKDTIRPTHNFLHLPNFYLFLKFKP